ncbi:MAG: efflux transporter outer membrane subunit [bacterium]
MRRFLLAFSVLLLVGCKVGPNYQRPAVPAPDAFRYQPQEAQDTANTAWWELFQDPVLDGLIAEALARNQNVQIAAASVEQAAAVLTQVRSPLFPQLNYGASAARVRSSEANVSPLLKSVMENPQSSYQIFAGASWEIDLWGRVRRLSEAARASLLASEEGRRGAVLSVVAGVAAGYLQLRGLDEQLAVARKNLASYGEAVQLFEVQFKHGQVSMMTVQQARTRYETAAATIPQIETQIVQTENALSILLGRNPSPIARGKSIHDLALPAVPSGLPSQLLERRPDVAQAEQNLIAANAQIGAARALYFPTISLTGDYGYASPELSDLFKGAARTWSYAGSIAGPIFAGGAIYGQVKEAEAARRAALGAYELAIQSAFADVENALIAHVKLGEQLQAQGRLVGAASEYARLAQLQYKGGFVPYSTVLQAQEQLFPDELNYASVRTALFTSLVDIYKAMGGGWVLLADGLAAAGEGGAAEAAP